MRLDLGMRCGDARGNSAWEGRPSHHAENNCALEAGVNVTIAMLMLIVM
jgi:hypothetical protein